MRRLLALATVAGMTLLGLVTPGEAAGEHATGTKERIVFALRRDDQSPKILTVNPDGTGIKSVPLEEPAETFAAPVWSPDRSQLLISNLDRGENVNPEFLPAIVEPDGSNFRVIQATDAPVDITACSAWTGDGRRLLCDLDPEQGIGGGVVSIRSSDGGGYRRLTRSPSGASDLATDISPDGTRFVFLRFRPGPRPRPNPFKTQQAAVFTANVDGGGVRQLTPFGLAFPHSEFSAGAQWSPDGKEIIFGTGRGRLFVVHLDGTGLSKIHLQTGTTRYFAVEPDWSPDGKQIVFGMFLNGPEALYTANADGSNVVQLTDPRNNRFVHGPDWGRRSA